MKKKKRGVSQIIYITVTILMMIGLLFPAFYSISISLQDEFSINNPKPQFIPEKGKNVAINVDYSEITNKENLEDLLLQDATVALFSTYQEQKKDGITAVEFYGTANGKTIFYSRAHTSQLALEKDYGVYKKTNPKQSVLLGKDRYTKFMNSIGYDFNKDGLKNKLEFSGQVNEVDLIAKIKGNYKEKYTLNGEIGNIEVSYSWMQLLEKYKYYFSLPKYMFSEIPNVAKYGLFAFMFNTVLTTVWAILCQVFIPAITAYPLATLFKKKTANRVMMFFLITMMIPFVSIMVPQLIIMKNMGMYDNYWAMLIPWLVPSPFYILLYKAFFERIPKSLFEAARIDGANELYIFTRICMPLSKSIISLIAIQAFISGWCDFFWYYMSTKKASLWTLNVAIFNISESQAIKQNFLMGISVVTIIPIFAFAFIFSRQLKEGVLGSAVKG